MREAGVEYRVTISAGDTRLGPKTRIGQAEASSDIAALYEYINTPIMTEMRSEVVEQWRGQLRVDAGDSMISVGPGSITHMTGLCRVPGLQVTVLITSVV
jgi:hypothetical protein